MADNLFASGRAETMEQAMSMAGEMYAANYQAGIDLKESRTEVNEATVPMLRARTSQAMASTEKLFTEMSSGITAAAKRTFDLATKELFGTLRSIQQERAGINRRLAESKLLPGDGQKRLDELDAEEQAVKAQIEAARGRALSGTPRRSAAAPQPGTRNAAPRGRVSRKNFDRVRAQNPSLAGKSDAEVEAALRAQGIEVY